MKVALSFQNDVSKSKFDDDCFVLGMIPLKYGMKSNSNDTEMIPFQW